MERMDAGRMLDDAAGKELAKLAAARALQERILARTGELLPDSVEELRELRAERDEQLLAPLSTDNLTPEQRQHTMRRVRSVDTGPEMAVRRLIHGMGYRYRLHRRELPGKPDLVFPARRKVIFVHGCFWHGHDCKAGRKQPQANADYWTAKLARNRARDAANQALLREHGWDVMVIWECRIRAREALREDIGRFLGPQGRHA